jgi:hypothetical protein
MAKNAAETRQARESHVELELVRLRLEELKVRLEEKKKKNKKKIAYQIENKFLL